MICNGRDFLNQKLSTDVCIVGSGQAGITLAWYLINQGIKVTILEGSQSSAPPNEPVDPSWNYNQNELLYNGEVGGLFADNEPHFLIRPSPNYNQNTKERDRIYGGTSTHWGGQSRPLDPIVFEEREGFPGWPIKRKDLDDAYEEACSFLGLYGDYYSEDGKIAGYNFTPEFWAKELNQKYPKLKDLEMTVYQFVPGQNLQFQALLNEEKSTGKKVTIGDSKARVILNASLLKIEHSKSDVNDSCSKVNHLTLGVMDKDNKKAGEFTISAKHYVLACGAVANARQLLLSDIGNEYDHVGRYLMSHPIANKGGYPANAISTDKNFIPANDRQLWNGYQDISSYGLPITHIAGTMVPSADYTRNHKTSRCWYRDDGSSNFYHGLLPCKESRITLSETEKDPVFGQPKTKATWILDKDAEENYQQLANLFKTVVQDVKNQDVHIAKWADVEDKMVFNGHHLGTTKMSAKKEDGVVDNNLKMHMVDNLYVAGSSVWASSGISNPTFSIVAFSIRLANYLGGLLKS